MISSSKLRFVGFTDLDTWDLKRFFYGELLESEEPLFISGRVNYRDEKAGIFVDTIRFISEVRETQAKRMSLIIDSESLGKDKLIMLRSTIQKFSGDKTFTFSIQTPESVSVTIIPEEKISFSSELFEELEEILPIETLKFHY